MPSIVRDWLDRNRGWITFLIMLLAIAMMLFMLTELLPNILNHSITAEWEQFRNSTNGTVVVFV